MSDGIHGLVTGVRAQTLGDALSIATTLGQTLIHVYDTADFDEDGGWISYVFAGVPTLVAYTGIDDDANTITLATGIHSVAVDTEISVWDAANAQPVVRYYATVDSVDGFDGDPVEAVVDQGLAASLSQSMRSEGTGESVTLVRDGSRLQVAKVHGRNGAMASLQYLQGGMTTRQSDTDAGVDILGVDSGTPGIYLYDVGGFLAMQITDDTAGGVTKFWTGNVHETGPGSINPTIVNTAPAVQINSPQAPFFGSQSTISVVPGQIFYDSDLHLFTGPVSFLDDVAASTVAASGPVTGTTIHGSATVQTDSGFFDNSLTGSSTTATINSSGHIIRTPSSRKYKSNIKPLKLADARKVLDLQPVTFTLKDEAKLKNRTTYPGFIAEQADEAGCDLWVAYDPDGKPDGFRYAEITAALVLLAREDRAEIAALKSTVADLTAAVAALKGA